MLCFMLAHTEVELCMLPTCPTCSFPVPSSLCLLTPCPPLPQFIEGRGRLVDAHTVEVGGKKYTAQNILVATGARAFVPKFEGSEHCIVSDHILEVPKVGGDELSA